MLHGCIVLVGIFSTGLHIWWLYNSGWEYYAEPKKVSQKTKGIVELMLSCFPYAQKDWCQCWFNVLAVKTENPATQALTNVFNVG